VQYHEQKQSKESTSRSEQITHRNQETEYRTNLPYDIDAIYESLFDEIIHMP